MPVDADLASHCLHPQLLGRSGLICPVQNQCEFAKRPHEACEGRSPLETFHEWLDAALRAKAKATKRAKKGMKETRKSAKREEVKQAAQATTLAFVIAYLERPYNPDAEAVLMEATRRIEG